MSTPFTEIPLQRTNSSRLVEVEDLEAEGGQIVFHDETERRRMECIIHHQATHDSLTGLINRQQFNKELEQLVDHARTHHAEHVLCYLGLDRFKAVNDTCGHSAGDEMLVNVASRLGLCVRSQDSVARLGGDEFAVLLSSANTAEGAITVAEKVAEGESLRILCHTEAKDQKGEIKLTGQFEVLYPIDTA